MVISNIQYAGIRTSFVLFAVIYLVLAMHFPVTIFPNAIQDDAFFVQEAMQLIAGHWLGPYDVMTFAKGPGFSFFLAFNYLLGTPITLSIALLYLFSCWLLVRTLRDFSLSDSASLVLFSLILFYPTLFPTHIIRDNICPALSLLVISLMIRFVYPDKYNNNNFIQVFLLGIAFGFCWITREDTIWMLPGLVVFCLIRVFQTRQQREHCQRILLRILISIGVFFLFTGSIAAINYFIYGKFAIVDVKSNPFVRTIRNLTSVDVGSEIPYVPVPFAKRQAIYQFSPSFSSLRAYFEDAGKGWTYDGCQVYPHTCGDYAGGWFMWALRYAVASKGFYNSSVHADAFYNELNNEIDQACNSGVAKCNSNLIALMPHITDAQIWKIPKTFLNAIFFSLGWPSPPVMFQPSLESTNGLDNTRAFLGLQHSTPLLRDETMILSGWYYSKNHDWVFVKCFENGAMMVRNITRRNSGDVAAFFKDPKASMQRFILSIPKNTDCHIVTSLEKSSSIPIKSSAIKNGQHFRLGDGDLHFDTVEEVSKLKGISFLEFKIYLINTYRLIMPLLVSLGLMSYLYCTISILMLKRSCSDVFIICTFLWILFISRVALLVIVDISSFPTINSPTYFSAAFSVLIVAAFLSVSLNLKFLSNLK